MRFDSISVLGAVRPRALTPAPALNHTQSGLSPFLTQPARHNAVLTIRVTYCLWLFLDLFLRLLHLHRIVCQSVPATPSLYYHSTKTHSIARAVKRCRFIHIPLEQTYSIPHFRISQTRHKLVTNSSQIRYFRLTITRAKTHSARYLYKRRLIHSIWTYAQPACIHRLGSQFNSIYSQTILSLQVTMYTNSLIIRLYTEFKLVRFKRPAKNSLNKFYTLPTL